MSIRHTSIVVGLGITFLLFVGMTLVSGHLHSDCGITAVLNRWFPLSSPCADDIVRIGFPVIMWENGGFAYRSVFSVAALLVNLASAIGVSCVISVTHAWLRNQARAGRPIASSDRDQTRRDG